MKNKKQTQPLVSVVMPVYNAQRYLKTAINSIKSQSYINWELIIVDDKSTDESLTLAKKIATKNPQIKVFQNKKHSGVATTANFALTKVKGNLVARMDADDIAHPDRLHKQVKYLSKHLDTVAVGSQCYLINQSGKRIGKKTFPTKINDIKKMMFYFYPLQQPTVMVNKKLLPKNFIWYQPGLEAAEEHELLFKFLQFGQVVNLPNFLLSYRIHDQNVTKKQPKKDFYLILKTRIRGIFEYHYLPSVGAIITNLAQLIIISLIPEKMIYPLYSKIRGLN